MTLQEIRKSQVAAGIAAILSVFLLGLRCTFTKYVVQDAVPESPSVTVIPASTTKDDLLCADKATGLLVGLGIKVVERPSLLKEERRYETQGPAGGIGFAFTGGQTVQTTYADPISLIPDCRADYVFLVRAHLGNMWVKVIRRDSGQILFADYISPVSDGTCCLPGLPISAEGRDHREGMRELVTRIGIIAK